MIVDKNGKRVIHPEDMLLCPFCGTDLFMIIPLARLVLGRGQQKGKAGIIPCDDSVVYCHKTLKLIPPEFFTTGSLPVEPPAAAPPAGKEPPECGPGKSSSASSSSSPPANS